MLASYSVRFGSTQPVIFRLSTIDDEGNAETIVDLSDVATVRVALRPKCGGATVEYDSDGGRVAVSSATGGTVSFAPEATTFAQPGAYEGWIELTDIYGVKSSFPSDGNFILDVVPTF